MLELKQHCITAGGGYSAHLVIQDSSQKNIMDTIWTATPNINTARDQMMP